MRIKRKLLGEKARVKIKQGIDEVANFVKITIGPKGRNVAFNRLGPLPTRAANDGITIADEIKSQDSFKQAGIEMVQEICKKTNFNSGDGTSQTALLAQAIIDEGQKRLLAGYNPIDLKRELEEDLSNLLKELDKMSNPIKSIEDIRNLATISGNNDEEIGNAVADVMDKLGFNASILTDKGYEEKIKVDTVKGMWFEKGYCAMGFCNSLENIAEYKEPNIYLVKSELKWDDEIGDFFFKLDEAKIKTIILIAYGIEGEALNTLCASHTDKYNLNKPASERLNVNILGIEAPFVGPDREEFMEDLATYIGATVLDNLTIDQDRDIDVRAVAGSCERIIATSKATTIVKGKGDKKEIEKKVKLLTKQIDETGPTEKITKEKLEKRRDTLSSGIGIIYAGGDTEIEIKDRRLRLEDAILASKSAIKEGFVAGGGFTYLMLSKLAKTQILRDSLKVVTKQIADNAGKSPDMILEKCFEKNLGYNAKTDKYCDLIEAGVLDATLVLKNALKNAVSLAGLFLTTEGIIVEEVKNPTKREEKELNG